MTRIKLNPTDCALKAMLLLWCAPVMASPNPLSGLAGLFYMILGAGTVLILVLLWIAFKRQSHWARNVLALPAILWVLAALPSVFIWHYSGMNLYAITVGLIFALALIRLYFRTFKVPHAGKVMLGLTFLCVLGLASNPAYMGFVGMVPENNDPFNGDGAVVKEVVQAGYIYTDEKGQYRVDNYLVLEDGRRIPGIFHGFRSGERVWLNHKNHGNYAIEVHGMAQNWHEPIKPAIQFPAKPWIQLQTPMHQISAVRGWGHDFD